MSSPGRYAWGFGSALRDRRDFTPPVSVRPRIPVYPLAGSSTNGKLLLLLSMKPIRHAGFELNRTVLLVFHFGFYFEYIQHLGAQPEYQFYIL